MFAKYKQHFFIIIMLLIFLLGITLVVGNWAVYHGYLNQGKFEREWQIHEIAKMADYYLPNPIGYENDFEKIILDQYYNNKEQYVKKMMQSFESYDDFTKGDALLIQGRVLNDKQSVCKSFEHYNEYSPNRCKQRGI